LYANLCQWGHNYDHDITCIYYQNDIYVAFYQFFVYIWYKLVSSTDIYVIFAKDILSVLNFFEWPETIQGIKKTYLLYLQLLIMKGTGNLPYFKEVKKK
jgi:hypothetical protein